MTPVSRPHFPPAATAGRATLRRTRWGAMQPRASAPPRTSARRETTLHRGASPSPRGRRPWAARQPPELPPSTASCSQPVLPALPESPLPQHVAPRENAAAIHSNVSRPPAPCSARQRVDSTSAGGDILSIGLVTTYGISFDFRLRRIRAGFSMKSCWTQLIQNFLFLILGTIDSTPSGLR